MAIFLIYRDPHPGTIPAVTANCFAPVIPNYAAWRDCPDDPLADGRKVGEEETLRVL
jgi:hypothetical protein